jgi:hypothetical protein
MTMTIAVSAFVALTLSPTMCALFLRDEKHAKHGRPTWRSSAAFDKMLAWYTRGLDFVLDHQRATLIRVSDHGRGDRRCCTSKSPRASSRSRTPASFRPVRRAAGHFLRRNGAPAARAAGRGREGSGRRELRHRSSAATGRSTTAS